MRIDARHGRPAYPASIWSDGHARPQNLTLRICVWFNNMYISGLRVRQIVDMRRVRASLQEINAMSSGVTETRLKKRGSKGDL